MNTKPEVEASCRKRIGTHGMVVLLGLFVNATTVTATGQGIVRPAWLVTEPFDVEVAAGQVSPPLDLVFANTADTGIGGLVWGADDHCLQVPSAPDDFLHEWITLPDFEIQIPPDVDPYVYPVVFGNVSLPAGTYFADICV